MNNVLLVFIGGGLGSLARYGSSLFITKLVKGTFPWWTLFSNVTASFILGLLAGFIILGKGQFETQRLFIGVGFCGGFSTFSTFSLEIFEFLKDGNVFMAFVYIITSVVAAFLAFWCAQMLMRS